MSVMGDLVKEGIFWEGDFTSFQFILLSNYRFNASNSAYTSTVVNIGGRDLDEEMAWWNADLRNV